MSKDFDPHLGEQAKAVLHKAEVEYSNYRLTQFEHRLRFLISRVSKLEEIQFGQPYIAIDPAPPAEMPGMKEWRNMIRDIADKGSL